MHTFLFISLVLFFTSSQSLSLKLNKKLAAITCGLSFAFNPQIANANANLVGEFTTNGLIFKDKLKINEFNDPKVQGISLYMTEFERPINEKLSGDFFNDPSSASLTCARTGPIVISKDIGRGLQGEEVFEESKNLFFKVNS